MLVVLSRTSNPQGTIILIVYTVCFDLMIVDRNNIIMYPMIQNAKGSKNRNYPVLIYTPDGEVECRNVLGLEPWKMLLDTN